jgi:hypothetical protein
MKYFTKKLLDFIFILAAHIGTLIAQPKAPELISAIRIWDSAPHNAFTDLVWFRGNFYCTFREGEKHVGGDGKIRVLKSRDGIQWESAALFEKEGIDLRDPKLSITPDKRIMLHIGGSVYVDDQLQGFKPAVTFSSDGKTWMKLSDVNITGDWPWRPAWHGNRVFVVAYSETAALYSGTDGINYTRICDLTLDGFANEAAIHFMSGDSMMILIRRDQGSKNAFIGKAVAPYDQWTWAETSWHVGGPALIRTAGNRVYAAGRCWIEGTARTVIGSVEDSGFTPLLTLPSGGDCSYPGMVLHKKLLWMSYYSTHEGKTSIYLARIKLN